LIEFEVGFLCRFLAGFSWMGVSILVVFHWRSVCRSKHCLGWWHVCLL